MQKRTRLVVSSGLALAVSLALVACSGKHPKTARIETAPPTTEDEPESTPSSETNSSAEGPGEADPAPVAESLQEFDETAKRPSPPRDPEALAKLEEKYREVPPERRQAALDSLLEVLSAHSHNRIQDKDLTASRTNIAAISDEVGWLSEHCKR